MDLGFLVEILPILVRAAWTTAWLTIATLVLSTIVALPLAVCGLRRPGRLSRTIQAWSTLTRSVPTLVILFLVYYGLPEMGIVLPALATALAGLTLSAVAYTMEILQSGLKSVDPGQYEAASALGLPAWRIWTWIIYPQSLPVVVPTWLSNATLILKGTSVASIITIPELTAVSNELVAESYRPFEILLSTAAIYILLGGLISLVARASVRRWSPR
jgi:His/Glu/Gln/Arg/opine family amino acid ABC transporter permease subunit